MKKKVFDIPKWWEYSIEKYGVREALQIWESGVSLEDALTHGVTCELEFGSWGDEVCKEIDVHKYPVGTLLKLKCDDGMVYKVANYSWGLYSLHFKTLFDNYLPSCIYKYLTEFDVDKYFEIYKKPKVKEMTVEEISKALGHEVKIVK